VRSVERKPGLLKKDRARKLENTPRSRGKPSARHRWDPDRARWWGCAAALLTLLGAVPNPANACSFAMTSPSPGVLSGGQAHSEALPRTVAFVTTRGTPLKAGTTDQWIVAQLDTGEAVVAFEVPGTRVNDTTMVAKPTTPLPGNTTFKAFRWTDYSDIYQTTTDTDDVAPSRPEVVGGNLNFHDGTGACSGDSCGDYTSASIRLKTSATDGQTSPERIVYAIYFGTSGKEAQMKASAEALYMGSSISGDSTLWENVDNDWMNHDVFVAVAAIDQSGNVSERSDPVQIHVGDSGGCAMRKPPRYRRSSSRLLVGIVAVGWWLHRRRRVHVELQPRS